MLSYNFLNCALWSFKVSPAPVHSPRGHSHVAFSEDGASVLFVCE